MGRRMIQDYAGSLSFFDRRYPDYRLMNRIRSMKYRDGIYVIDLRCTHKGEAFDYMVKMKQSLSGNWVGAYQCDKLSGGFGRIFDVSINDRDGGLVITGIWVEESIEWPFTINAIKTGGA